MAHSIARVPSVLALAPSVSATPERTLVSRFSDQSLLDKKPGAQTRRDPSAVPSLKSARSLSTKKTVHSISALHPLVPRPSDFNPDADADIAASLSFLSITSPPAPAATPTTTTPRRDKASQVLGIPHRKSMEPIPASARTSLVSTRSARAPPPLPAHTPTSPLTSLYVVSGLPKSPNTWTLADPDSVLGLQHADGAVSRFWRAEVLGSTVSPGAGGGKKKRKGKGESEMLQGAGALSKQEVGKMLSKALKLSFTREVEIIASTLQPASTIHTFTFTLPAPPTPLAPATPSSSNLLRTSMFSSTTGDSNARNSLATYGYPYHPDPDPSRPSSSYLGVPSFSLPHTTTEPASGSSSSSTITYHGVCLTVWSHADGERSAAIRRTLESSSAGGRSRKESVQSLLSTRLRGLRSERSEVGDSAAHMQKRKSQRGPWGVNTDAETDMETEADGAVSESDFDVASTVGHGPGESTLFLPGDTVFWLPYALTLVSRHPVYDLMRDYLTLSWARFSKDVQSHTLQISKILSYPAPRAGDLIKLDASPKDESGDASLEVIARFPGGLDFGKGLVDINFTMWPLFKCLNIDNILTICEVALAPTGRILFLSRHPAILGIAVATIKYLVELRGWNGISLPAVHSRDAKIYIEDPGPWLIGLATEARYSIRPPAEVCVVDLDINHLSCASPPPGYISVKHQRDRYRQKLLAAFEPHYHPDHSIPSEFKEAFPAGRFRPVCKIQAKRGGASSASVAEPVQAPPWWNSTRIIQAFDGVLQERTKKPSFLRRLTLTSAKRAPRLTVAEQHIQYSIRKRATAFVDARDDLETKIGRLSRRLNFLMTESDLWRDKFVMFEQYAEKLSGEASELRSKINKEQKETKRLSSLVSMTTTEKDKLNSQLSETEAAHKEAMEELERMRVTMARMEQEREDMMAEVETQIEMALASMTINLEESDDDSSHASLPRSRSASRSTSRRPSDATRTTHLRSVATESTLAEAYVSSLVTEKDLTLPRTNGTLVEEDEEERPVSPAQKRRFSVSDKDAVQDGMSAMDAGISEKSDKIAQKVLQIQQKLETALAADARDHKWRDRSVSRESESELSESDRPYTRPRRTSKLSARAPSSWQRPGTASSTQTARTGRTTSSSVTAAPVENDLDEEPVPSKGSNRASNESTRTTTGIVDAARPPSPTPLDLHSRSSTISLAAVRTSPTVTTPSLTPSVTTSTADDSDTDFQSAYSASPRGSYVGSFDAKDIPDDDSANEVSATMSMEHRYGDHTGNKFSSEFTGRKSGINERSRVSSTATATRMQPSPTLSEDTVIFRSRLSSARSPVRR